MSKTDIFREENLWPLYRENHTSEHVYYFVPSSLAAFFQAQMSFHPEEHILRSDTKGKLVVQE